MKYSFLVFLFALALSCTNTSTGQTQSGTDKLSAKAFAAKLDQTPEKIILDVRTPGEYSDGHVKGAVNVDWEGSTFTAQVEKLDKSKPVFVYCSGGGRSSSAVRALNKKGFVEIHDLDGGLDAWRKAGLPEEK